jgi:hypothetical protein
MECMAKLYFLLGLALFTSCLSTRNFLRDDQIPDDFGTDNKSVFIMLRPQDGVKNMILDAFKLYYKGPYSYGENDRPSKNFGYSFTSKLRDVRHLTRSFTRRVERELWFELKDLETNRVFVIPPFGTVKNRLKYYVQALEIMRQRNQ